MTLASTGIYQFDAFTLDVRRASLRRGETPIALRPKSFDLLHYLAANAGRVTTRDELTAALWPRLVVTDDSLTRCISDVRAALGDRAQTMVRTVPRRGYLFAADVQQLQASAIEIDAPAASSTIWHAATLRTNLPEAPLPLIGREADLAAVGALIAQHRLVTLVGPGGVGKSRLAQWLLHERRQAFEHGVAWVDLAPLADPARLAGSVITALGVSAGSGDPLAALLATVRPLRLLMALDNAEHLIDAVAALAQALHEAAPGVHLLITSQASLKLAAETVFRLGALPVPDAAAGIEASRGFGAVSLFAQRAQAADARFTLTDRNIALAIEVCRRLDGLPLAIELAAAHAPWLGLPRLASALGERFRALTSGHRGASARHRTLRAAMEWSHALLSEAEQTVFRRLAVFAGSFPLELAQRTVADPHLDQWQVLEAIGGLVERSLVATDGGDAPRYRLLETPRAFAMECLQASGEAAALQQRHATAYRDHFEQAYHDYFSGRQLVDTWRERLSADLDDGRAAFAWSLSEDATTAVALAALLSFVFSAESPREQRGILDASKPLISGDLPPKIRARWAQEAAFCFADSQPVPARAWAVEAVALFSELDEPLDTYRALGTLVYWLSANDINDDCAELAQMQALEDPAWPPVVRAQRAHALGCWYSESGDFETAIHWRRQSLELYERAGHTWRRLVAQANLLDSLLAAGGVDDAIECGLDLQNRLRGTRQMAALPAARMNLAAALLARDDTAQARALAIEAWPQAVQLNWQAYWADYLALMAVLEARPLAACRLLGYSDACYRALDIEREVNEARAARRAGQLALAHLPAGQIAALKIEGAALRDEQVAALAFATSDTP